MKTKLVLWGTNEKEEKVLIGLELRPKDNKVNIYVFPEALATEEFGKQMFDEWRNGTAILFPEGYQTIERELTLTEGLLPDELKVERGDVIQRAQTEWQFVVLSSKLNEVYQTELAELKEKIEQLTQYDSKVWEGLKGFWSKVQGQVRERNLFRDHADTLRQGTNELFTKMKEMRKVLDKEFEAMSENNFQGFKDSLNEIEEKVAKGMNLNNIFNELKDMQRRFRDTKLTKDHRNKIWNELDGMFKKVKEKKYGPEANTGNSPADRLKKRYDGLLSAIGKMENSIRRDREDLAFQDRKIANTDGQLEAQIRQAKIKMIEERIRSKEVKLKDMHETREELEKRMEQQKAKDAKRAEQQKIEQAKAEAKAKIKEEMKAAEAARKGQGEKLEKAAEAITGKTETKADEMVTAISNRAEEVVDQAKEAFEDAVDTVKAIAEVIGGKIEHLVEEAKEKVEEMMEEPKAETTTDAVPTAITKVVEKPPVIEIEPKPAVIPTAPPTVSAEVTPEDLKIVEGIGPKIEEILHHSGIKTYTQLAGTTEETLRSILQAAGSRYNSKNPATWPKQAKLAATGKWDELKAWQEMLDGGIDRSSEEK